ncbi:MAG: tRNA (N(6)-L-threonylcarbamoyladenosine(37)-C(2))-methylthiotransferase MtaB [Clostridia bacterium]|nr:MAG: tRNA (N(6)-L-threonylcarbamoyladenosine(37)-C(2))-methylthiotransferase MtaB [Clostridia bacterium]
MARTVACHVLGCKVNQHEARGLQELFRQAGYEVVDFADPADVYVVHTCTVTHLSNRKCRQAIRRAVRTNPQAVVAVTGCYAQVAPEEIEAIPGVGVIVGSTDRHRLVELVEEAAGRQTPVNLVREWGEEEAFEELPVYRWSRARALVKVEEGCEEGCTYCIVPRARGPVRSRRPEGVVAEVARLVNSGYKEIILTGVHLGAYGRDAGGMPLAALLTSLVAVPGLCRLRLSSLEPTDFTADLLQVLAANEVICPHWHIPLQSGADPVLARMGRRYATTEFAGLVRELRRLRPGAAITTDIIVGFPGETEDLFAASLSFVAAMEFSRLHVFPFSPRPGTLAADLPGQVPDEVKAARSQRMRELSAALARRYAEKYLGRTLEVLVERGVPGRPGWWEGHTPNYLLVEFVAPGPDLGGDLVPVRIRQVGRDRLVGEAKL